LTTEITELIEKNTKDSLRPLRALRSTVVLLCSRWLFVRP